MNNNNMEECKIGLILNINYLEKTEVYKFVCTTLEECRKNIIDSLISILSNMTIDFPIELEEFDFIWYDNSNRLNNFFDYEIFNGSQWIKPFLQDDIYSDTLEEMLQREIPIEHINSDEDID